MVIGVLIVAFVVSCFMGIVWFWGDVVYVAWNWSVSIAGAMFRDYSFDFLFGEVSWGFMYMLFLCGSVSLWYCLHYYSCGKGDLWGLHYLMVGFLEIMLLLVLTNSMMLSLIFWEFLGFVSFVLVLYYANMRSMRASLIVLVASRLGDVSLFFLVGHFQSWAGVCDFVAVLFFLLVGLTKSATYPFISWLVEAMRAPTPVSSLVHSSTLVAAGAWFLVRYCCLFDFWMLDFLFIVSVLTILISGCCALFFMDLKKLIALSTCNNIAWCLVFYVFGGVYLALFQLLVHGVCKCYLFMSVGDLMSSSGSSQESVAVYVPCYSGSFSLVVQSLLVFSLCGLPFLGSFFCKHLLLLYGFYGFDLVSLILLVMGVFVSYAYSLRLSLLLASVSVGLSVGYVSVFVALGFVSLLGSFIGYICGEVCVENLLFGVLSSVCVLLVEMFGSAVGLWLVLNRVCFSVWFSELCGNDSFVGIACSFLSSFVDYCILSNLSVSAGFFGLSEVEFSCGLCWGFCFELCGVGCFVFYFCV
uniref:NADH:ubiquinone reductase (H(+)-translocating) n=1 Tax=Brachylecithum sp. PakAb2 TaxID=2714092 RepID=A0A6H0YBQ8_9TREM|nr:NADH dehydrogenase subunit 5 [Brachylecithum sp. PakAb2]